MFQTAFPFGYLIQFLVLTGAIVVALVLIASGLNPRRKGRFRAGLALAGVVALVFGVALAQPRVDDWHPRFPRHVVYGEWVDGERSLELRADGTYTLREGPSETSGRYDLDGNLRLLNGAGRPLAMPPLVVGLRVVEVDGEYRIINDPYEPDVWDGWLGYRHNPPAMVR